MPRILWIEDDIDFISDIITPLIDEGFKVEKALNYTSAIKKLVSHQPYDLILLDLILPSGIENYTSINEIKRIEDVVFGLKILEFLNENNKTVPVIVFSVVSGPTLIEVRKYPFVKNILRKGSIKPSDLKEEVLRIIGYGFDE